MNELRLNRIGEHVYWLSPDGTTDRPVLGAVAGARGTVLVDTGNSPAHAEFFLRALEAAGAAAPSLVVLTHWHWDHVFGSATIALPTIAHVETKRHVEEMAGLDWRDDALDRRVAEGREIEFCRDMIKLELSEAERARLVLRVPEIAFQNEVEIDLGDVHCRVVHVGGDHAEDSTIVQVPEAEVVFLGDCISPSIYGGPRAYRTQVVGPLMDRLLGLDAAFYLAGHDDEPLTREALAEYAALLRAIGDAVRRRRGDREAILADLRAASDPPFLDEDVEVVDMFLVTPESPRPAGPAPQPAAGPTGPS